MDFGFPTPSTLVPTLSRLLEPVIASVALTLTWPWIKSRHLELSVSPILWPWNACKHFLMLWLGGYCTYSHISFWNQLRTKCIIFTWEAREKLGPGDRFLLGRAGALFAAPPLCDPFLFRRLLAGRCDSKKQSMVKMSMLCFLKVLST